MIALPSSFLRVTPGPMDSRGLIQFTMAWWCAGQILDQVVTVSGQPGHQVLRRAADAVPGSLEPLGEGAYAIGDADSVNGVNRTQGSFGAGLGNKWLGLHPLAGYGPERAEGVHWDSNADTSPGTAACEGTETDADMDRVCGWFAGPNRPTILVADYGLGSVPPPPMAPGVAWLKVFRKPTAFSAMDGGDPLPSGRVELEWSPGTLHVALNGQALRVQQLELQLCRSAAAASPSPAPPAGAPQKIWDVAAQLASPDSDLSIAIGCAEGTRTADGAHTQAWEGHTDPGNRGHNQGTFSFQGAAISPVAADQEWLAQMRTRMLPAYLSACQAARLEPGTPLLAAAAFDLYTQSPGAATLPGGFLDQLGAVAAAGVTPAALVDARCRSYVDPATGKLEAPGFNNDPDRLRADQQRRVQALADCIAARQASP